MNIYNNNNKVLWILSLLDKLYYKQKKYRKSALKIFYILNTI